VVEGKTYIYEKDRMKEVKDKKQLLRTKALSPAP